MAEDFFVRRIAEGYGVEAVRLHELIENVGAEHNGARNGYWYAVEIVADRIFFDDRVNESQAAAFASERTLADAGEVGVVVEAVFLEDGHDSAVFHLAIFYNQVEEQLAHLRGIFQVAEAVVFDHLCNREHGARVEPARDVVERGMPVEGLGGDVEDVFLQVFQRFDAEDLFAGFGIADHEVAEAEVVDDGLAEVYGKFFWVLVDERAAELDYVMGVFVFGTFDDHRQVGGAWA